MKEWRIDFHDKCNETRDYFSVPSPGKTPIGPEKTAEYLALGLFHEVKSIPCEDPPGFRKDECVAYFKYLVDNYGNYPDVGGF